MIYVQFQAGPGTIAESMIRGLPIILNDYIAGQVFSFREFLFHISIISSHGASSRSPQV